MFGWALHESQERYPQVLSATEIQRRLGIAKNSALLLKRRLQLLASDQTPKIKTLIQSELSTKFTDTKLPHTSDNQHVSTVLASRPVPQADSCVLYSASQRANQGRKRYKHTGQTASIYMSDKLGGRQIGTLVHTISWKGGPIIYDSIPNNQAETLRPLLDSNIPKDVPLFTDEGYKFYYRINRNHRMVNHNRKSSDPRYRWARNRWSINGVHNQVAEGNHRNLKYNFIAGYSYITPRYSQLYLNEYAFWKNLKYYGWDKLTVSQSSATAPTPTTPISNLVPDLIPGTSSSTPDMKTSSSSSARVSTSAPASKPQSSSDEPQKPSSQSVDFSPLRGIPSRITLSHHDEQHTSSTIFPMEEVTGSNHVFRRNTNNDNHTGSHGTLRAADPQVGIRRRSYPGKGWLSVSLAKHLFHPLTLDERKRVESNSGNINLEEELRNLTLLPEYSNLKQAIEDNRLFQKRQKKHESVSQKLYEFHANQIWEFLDDNEWSDLDSIVDHLQISRAKAYRIIRTWAIASIAKVVDRSHPDGYNFKLIYDLKKNIPVLPTVRYVLDREHFAKFETLYSKCVNRHYEKRKSNRKYDSNDD